MYKKERFFIGFWKIIPTFVLSNCAEVCLTTVFFRKSIIPLIIIKNRSIGIFRLALLCDNTQVTTNFITN